MEPMNIMDVQVLFDRADRRYRFGDEVSGKVIVSAEHFDFTFSKVWFAYGWRTHGKGDRDKGGEDDLILAAEKTSLRAGEHKEFSFRFQVPNGPVTYHGHYLNVDWYLTAHVIGPPGAVFECEQDFLLLGGDPTGAIDLGHKEVALQDIPVRSPVEPSSSTGLLEVKAGGPKSSSPHSRIKKLILSSAWWIGILGFTVLGFGTTFGLGRDAIRWGIVGIFVAVAIAAIYYGVVTYAFRQRLEMGGVWVKPAIVYPGCHVNCHVDFRTKKEAYLHNIKASIYAQECVSRTVGTTTQTDHYTVSERTLVKPFDEQVSEGRSISFDCVLPVEADAPATFDSTNNHLEWKIRLEVELERWLGWDKTFPITVLP
jgi:hypothetical protein